MSTIKKSATLKLMIPKYVLIAVAVVALLGGGWYFYSNKTASMPYSQNNSQESSMGDKISGKFADLINAGRSMECTFSGETDGYKTTGTVFVAGKNMRRDFNSESKGKMMDSHMIQDDDTIYTWTTDPKQGTMMKISKEDVAKYKDGPADDSNKSFDMDQSYDYDCKAWGTDPSKFNKPGDIEFMDLSAQMEKATKSMNQSNNSACSACDQIEDEDAKASCKQALNC